MILLTDELRARLLANGRQRDGDHIPVAKFWAVGHFAAVWAAKRDPLFVEVGRRHLKLPGHLAV